MFGKDNCKMTLLFSANSEGFENSMNIDENIISEYLINEEIINNIKNTTKYQHSEEEKHKKKKHQRRCVYQLIQKCVLV